MSEKIRYPEELDERKELFVVQHAQGVWKNVFFKSQDQAFNTVQMFHKGQVFKKQGMVMISSTTNARFTVRPLREYTKMDDIRYYKEWGD